jgi:glycosyltransferase involved in cell wall biosynthesis
MPIENAKKNTAQHSAWITWEIQIRNRSMAALLAVPLYELIVNKHRLIRYPVLIYQTLRIIYKNNVRILFVQNPSIVLSMLAVVLRTFRDMKVIVDAHNSGVYPLENRSRFLSRAARFIARKADAIIVTNTYLANAVQSWGANPIIMPDPVPDLHPNTDKATGKPYLFFICTWAEDEPYLEVFQAATLIPQHIDIYITGNYNNKLTRQQLDNLPANIKLLGFVPEHDYIGYFSSCLIAIDLTTRDNCLVCGAYEALSLQKPCIVSDSQVNHEIFSTGFVYTKNNASAIASAIKDALDRLESLNTAITIQASTHKALIEERASELKRILHL